MKERSLILLVYLSVQSTCSNSTRGGLLDTVQKSLVRFPMGLLLIHKRPGNNEHLCRKFDPHLCFNASLPFPSDKLTCKVFHNALISGRCDHCRLIEGIPEIGLASFRDHIRRVYALSDLTGR